MTREKGTLLEGFCWFVAGLAVIFAIAKFAFNYR
jgi:hypothetical protein